MAELSSNGLHEGTLNYEIGDAALKNEKNFEIDLSARYATAAFALEAAMFRDHFDDYIYLAPTTEQMQGFRVYRFLQTEANLRGMEASLDWIPPAIAWLDFRSNFSKVIGKRADGGYLPLMPGDKWSNALKVTSRRTQPLRDSYLKLTVTKVFSQDHLAPTEKASPGYTLVDLAVGGNANLLGRPTDLNLVCRNLFSTVYYDHLSRLKPGSFNVPSIGFNNIGRNICLYIGFPFDLK
ncbi:MAG: hypothetical protein ALAOOOJD_01839 [bacterium]|nr:hypothetical protein [bacterium]